MNSPFVSEKYIKLEALKTFLFSYQEVWLLYLTFTTYPTPGAKQSPPSIIYWCAPFRAAQNQPRFPCNYLTSFSINSSANSHTDNSWWWENEDTSHGTAVPDTAGALRVPRKPPKPLRSNCSVVAWVSQHGWEEAICPASEDQGHPTCNRHIQLDRNSSHQKALLRRSKDGHCAPGNFLGGLKSHLYEQEQQCFFCSL